MEFETLLYEKSDGIATVTLNRPERHNALTLTMARELRRLLHRTSRLICKFAEIYFPLMARLSKHIDICSGTEHPFKATGDNYGFYEDGNIERAMKRIEDFIATTRDTTQTFRNKVEKMSPEDFASVFGKTSMIGAREQSLEDRETRVNNIF